MYFADSDFLSILLMLLTIGAGLYSSLAKGKKKGDDSGNVEPEEKPSTFEELFGGTREHYREEDDCVKEYEYERENEYDCKENEKYEEYFTDEEDPEYSEYGEKTYVDCVDDADNVGEVDDVDNVDNVDDVSRMPERDMSDSNVYTFSDEHACSMGGSSVNAESVSEVAENDENGKPEGLKEKLKQSPKDMVLFSEIMKPKYKDF